MPDITLKPWPPADWFEEDGRFFQLNFDISANRHEWRWALLNEGQQPNGKKVEAPYKLGDWFQDSSDVVWVWGFDYHRKSWHWFVCDTDFFGMPTGQKVEPPQDGV